MSFSSRAPLFPLGLVAVLALFILGQTSYAQQETRNILNNDGNVIFQLDFYGQDQGSSDDFTQMQMDAIEEAAQYWVDMLKAHGELTDGQPVIFEIYYDDAIVGNANAITNGFVQSADDGFNVSLAEAIMVDGVPAAPVGGGHATINVGSGWNFTTDNQSAVGRVPDDFTPVMIHELGHALGILSSAAGEVDPITGEVTFRFPEVISRYDSRLRDNNGNSPLTKPGATGGKLIGYDDPADGRNADTIFDMGDPHSPPPSAPNAVGDGFGNPSQVTFVGKNTLELWYGKQYNTLTKEQKNRGVPILGYTYGISWDYPLEFEWAYTLGGSLGHINTTNSLMSWQAYRNYSGFIEIEMAVMQDLGYDVERRNFFGKSFYVDGDGRTPFYNDSRFAYWDEENQRYDMKRANDADFAIGAHLFAKNLNIVQTGSIWANGPGAAGIRIDGMNNQLTLAKGTTIRTDGLNGIGILAAYGKDHTITLQQGSSVRATGPGGIGVGFDFGTPVIGDTRGSYYYGIITDQEGGNLLNIGYLPELYGSLVNDLNVNGTITGSGARQILPIDHWWAIDDAYSDAGQTRSFSSGAAIYIDDTAAVERINIMQGAEINGNILSHWTGAVSPLVVVPEDPGTGEAQEDTGTFVTPGVPDAGYFPMTPPEVVTAITFGYKADEQGKATQQVDKNFKITYNGNINYFRYEVIPDILYLDVDRVDHDRKVIYIPLGEEQGNGFHPGNIDLEGIDPEDLGLEEFDPEALPDDEGYWVSPAYGDNDVFWEFVTWDDGFMGYEPLQIVRPGDGKVYADVVTPGRDSMKLHFVGGITEFLGNTAYVSEVKVDQGATLTLTPGETNAVPSYVEIDGEYYTIFSDAEPVIKMPEIHVAADFNEYVSQELAPYRPTTKMVNEGRITGDGAFYIDQRRYWMDETMLELYGVTGDVWRWEGTFTNNGTIAPGAKNGAEIGTILIQGNLDFGQYGVFEVTIGGPKEERYHSGMLADGKYVDQHGMIYDTVIGCYRGENTTAIRGTGNDLVIVTNNTKMDGTLKIHVLPDSVFGDETTTHTIIQSGSFTAGANFKNIEYDQAFLAITDVFINPFNEHEAQIKVVRDLDFFEERGKTQNEIAVAKAVDSSLFPDARLAFSLGDKRNSDVDIRDMLRQMGASVRANSAMMNLWSPSEQLFNRVGWGNGLMETGDRGRINWKGVAGPGVRGQSPMGPMGQRMPRQRAGGLWGDYFNTTFNAESDGNSDKYNITRNGFMVGGEWGLTPYSAIGAIAAYANGKLDQRGDKVKSDDYMLGLYFVAAPFNKFEVKGFIGTGFQQYDFDRRVHNTNIYTDSLSDVRGVNDRYIADTNGNTLNLSLEFARPIELHPTFILRPTLGFDSQFMWQDGYKEKNYNAYYNDNAYGSYLYALNFSKMSFNRTMLRVGFNTETSGSRGSIRMRAFYVSNLGDDTPVSASRFVSGSDPFSVSGVKLGNDFLNLGVGTNLWLDGEQTASFVLEYDANIYNMSGRKMNAHTFSLGLSQNF